MSKIGMLLEIICASSISFSITFYISGSVRFF